MKEGQNLSYVTRIGAYGFAVVAAFAVALAVLACVPPADPDGGVGAKPPHRRKSKGGWVGHEPRSALVRDCGSVTDTGVA